MDFQEGGCWMEGRIADAADEIGHESAALSGTIDLHGLITAQQRKLLEEQRADHELLGHPGASGDAGEINWIDVIQRFLPTRYVVTGKAFVIDALGEAVPQQIDILIHDQHFCPVWFENRAGTRFIPAEAVYAAIEVKPEFDRNNFLYAAEKAASVRRLSRTSASIIDCGVLKEGRKPFEILGGILALKSGWRSPPLGEPFKKIIRELARSAETRIDIGCALEDGGFDLLSPPLADPLQLEYSDPDSALMFFLLRLFGRLQQLGSPPAIDWREYTKALDVHGLELVNGMEG
jgi:hypothetical protein